jgi:hypothetical protein
MTVSARIPDPEIKVFGLIRDRNGTPVIDGDPNDLPDEIKAMLTPEEREALGIEEAR